MYHYAGNLHIHSDYSDGFGSIQQIARAAEQAGLDFIIVTDHCHLKALTDEGYYGSLLVLVGMEINNAENHYLALGVQEEISNGQAQDIIDAVNWQQGIGIIAHPDEKGSPIFDDQKAYRWIDWSVNNFQGIEVWNHLSQFKDEVTGVLKGLYLLYYPPAALKGPYKETVERLDSIQKQDLKVFAFGGSDAHGIKIRIGRIKIPIISAYDLCFRCINTHIISDKKLTGILQSDKKIIYEALRQGRFWIGFDYYKNSRDFEFVIRGQEKQWFMGEEARWQKNLYAEIKTPVKARARLIKDGGLYAENLGRNHRFPIDQAGVYRVEAYHKHLFSYRLWIQSNPIWIKP